MSVLIALIVLACLIAGGLGAGLWRLGAVVADHADRLGVGRVRGGLVVERMRAPMLLWTVALTGAGVLLAVAWGGHRIVLGALILGIGFAVVTAFALPRLASVWVAALARRVGRGVQARVRRRTARR